MIRFRSVSIALYMLRKRKIRTREIIRNVSETILVFVVNLLILWTNCFSIQWILAGLYPSHFMIGSANGSFYSLIHWTSLFLPLSESFDRLFLPHSHSVTATSVHSLVFFVCFFPVRSSNEQRNKNKKKHRNFQSYNKLNKNYRHFVKLVG